MYTLYKGVTSLLSPFIPLLLRWRLARGKENAARLSERLGYTSHLRPKGKLLWIHAASVGEANAVLPLIEALLAAHPRLNILLTTITVTSAELMGTHLPAGAIHQFAPIDTPSAVQRFLTHWQPDVALWVDSELWPILILETYKNGAVMGMVNGRMSTRSFRRWQLAPAFIARMLSCFHFCFAQSADDAQRLQSLGMKSITRIGNLKYDAPALPCNEAALAELMHATSGRTLWLAASTHPGEEEIIAQVHKELVPHFPHLLTVIVPRHAARGEHIAKQLAPLRVARRSLHEPIESTTGLYLADTMGELGLFYRLCPIAFIGGSLVPHGGQNPLEAARLNSAIILGTYTANFAAIVRNLEEAGACIRVEDTAGLVCAVKNLLTNPAQARNLCTHALLHAQSNSGVIEDILKAVRELAG